MQMFYEEPSIKQVRVAIENIAQDNVRTCLQFILLTGCRSSEAVGYKSPNDDTTNYGITRDRVEIHEQLGEEAAVFRLRTAKRKGMPRFCAIPLSSNYEVWTRDIVKMFDGSPEPVWSFTRQRLHGVCVKAFDGMVYPIAKYLKGEKKNWDLIPEHWKPARAHALRHFRASDLSNFYGFDAQDLSMFLGWTMGTGSQMPSVASRYITQRWQRYFPKLLKTRR
jgi:integrase